MIKINVGDLCPECGKGKIVSHVYGNCNDEEPVGWCIECNNCGHLVTED